MKKNLWLALLLPLLFGSCGILDSKNEKELSPAVIELPAHGKELIQAGNQFGINLFRETASGTSENLMLSPLSASIALTMLLNGAGGDTYAEIHDMLGYDQEWGISDVNGVYKSLVGQLLNVDKEVQLAIANAVFYDHLFSVKDSFLNVMSDDFQAEVSKLDFRDPASVNTINKWAADNTNNKVPEVIEQLNPEDVMLLMNAIYFKANWSVQFKKSDTATGVFYLADGNEVTAPFMQGKIPAMTHNGIDYTVVELPYGRRNFSMVLLLPEAGLDEFYPGLTPEKWNAITSNIDQWEQWQQAVVIMPRFGFETDQSLKEVLKQLGMVEAFLEQSADLSGISDPVNGRIFVSEVKQNSFVEVNEEGTEAAAVTTVVIGADSGPQEIHFNKPFVFAIRERTTNTLLFIGQVTNPVQ